MSQSIKPLDTFVQPRLMGAAATLVPYATCCSSSRSVMTASFLSQMLVVEGANARPTVTGAEREYGKYTMSIEVPCRCRVIKIIKKYPRQLGVLSFKKNSVITILYESLENGEFGCIHVPNYHWNHKIFGFEYKINPIVKNLAPGTLLEKGTILADSPSVKENGDYWYGINTKTVFMSLPGIIEDGVIVSDEYCKKLRSKGYGSAIMEWGTNSFPLNLYCKHENDYRYFPDIGDRIRDDGVLFAIREYDPVLAVCNMSNDALRSIDHIFDKITYITPQSVSSDDMPIVENISVWHTHNQDLWRTPTTMERQVKDYLDATRIYHTDIYNCYRDEFAKRKGKIVLSKEYHNTLVKCCINDNNIPKMALPRSVARTFRQSRLDDYRVQIDYSWTITPGNGYKITDTYGQIQ